MVEYNGKTEIKSPGGSVKNPDITQERRVSTISNLGNKPVTGFFTFPKVAKQGNRKVTGLRTIPSTANEVLTGRTKQQDVESARGNAKFTPIDRQTKLVY